MDKRIFLAVASLAPFTGMAQKQPNIIFLLADDMRASTVGAMGREQALTPNLDKLVADGVLLSNAHIMGGSNGAVSMPSRAMLLTGKYVYNLEKEGAVIPENHKTIGEALIDVGYNNYHIGKWHSDRSSFNRCFNDGMDIFFGGMSDHWNVPLYSYNKEGDYSKKRPVIKSFTQNNEVEYLAGEYCFSGKHSVDIFTRRAVEFIDNVSEDKPFYLNVAYMSPHDPRSTHTKFHDFYDSLNVAMPANFMREHPFDNGEMIIRDEALAAYPREEGEVKEHIKDYYAMITHLDQSIGEIIEALKAKGLYDNTIIVFAGDNGLAVGQHGLMGKQNVYEHSINIPLIVKPVGGFKGKEHINNSPCYLIDIMPTLLEYAGAAIPESVDAKSLIPVLEQGKDVRDRLYYCYREVQRSVSDMTWKLIEYNVKGERYTQLFNIAKDPMESLNLASDKRYSKEIVRLRKAMRQEKVATNDNGKFWESIEF